MKKQLSSPSFLIVLGCAIIVSFAYGRNVDNAEIPLDDEVVRIQEKSGDKALQQPMDRMDPIFQNDLTQGQKECLDVDEITGYCIPPFMPCGCKDQFIYNKLAYYADFDHWDGIQKCQELPETKYICVPGYEKCLNEDPDNSWIVSPALCLPKFVNTPDECEEDIWTKLKEKFGGVYTDGPISPCLDYLLDFDPSDDDSVWNK